MTVIYALNTSTPRLPVAFFLALAAAVAASIGFGLQLGRVAAGETILISYNWIPSLGIDLAFRFDGLSLLFALLISVIGILVVIYASAYLRHHPDQGRLQLLLMAFMGSMLGLVTADHVVLLFVFWELTTVTSFLLVGFDHEKASARRSALQALLVTGFGGLALLVGLIVLAESVGSYRLSEILAADPALIQASSFYPLILILVLIGAFTKSAQFPFHFWLPNAMAAPTPVSAYLHSATMVKAGIYLMARLQPTLGGTDAWFYALTIAGAITAVWSSMMALRQTDLKLMLAWTTVMALGTLTMFLGSSIGIAVLAAITFLIVHAFYKCALFLVIGNVDHGAGTRDIERLGGLGRAMPITALIAAAAGLSMAGVPPFLGFIGKELKYEGALAIADGPLLIAGAAIAANAMMVAVAMAIVIRVFFMRAPSANANPGHEAPIAMWAGPFLLAAAGLLTGLLPSLIGKMAIAPAVNDVLREDYAVKLYLWHGVNLPLMMSLVTVGIGAVLFWRGRQVRAGLDRLVGMLPMTGDRAFDLFMAGIQAMAVGITRRLQTGVLGHYLIVVFSVIVFGAGAALVTSGVSFHFDRATPVPLLAWPIAAMMVVAAAVVVISRSRLLAIAALGLVGIGVALIFLMFSAIDVAMTQLLIETLFVVLIAVVLLKLPGFAGTPHPGRLGQVRDAVIAIGAGLVVAMVTIGVALTPLDLEITRFFEQSSYPEAYGQNIVNVILVDFRALDTLGEIAVVGVAALAVIALLKVRPRSVMLGRQS